MTAETRHQRVRRLVRAMNRQRKQQAKQINILCHDLINAQREFIRRLGTISFAASFYQAILGITDAHTLFQIAGQHIHEVLPEVKVVFCRPGFEPWCFCAGYDDIDASLCLEQYLDADVTSAISQANQSCDIQALLALGLQVNPSVLSAIKAATVPLTDDCHIVGFLLLYRRDRDFQPAELAPIEALAGGLARALAAAAPTTQQDA